MIYNMYALRHHQRYVKPVDTYEEYAGYSDNMADTASVSVNRIIGITNGT